MLEFLQNISTEFLITGLVAFTVWNIRLEGIVKNLKERMTEMAEHQSVSTTFFKDISASLAEIKNDIRWLKELINNNK